MRICFALLYYDRMEEGPEAYVQRKIIPEHLPAALAARDHDVEVVVLFHSDAVVVKDNVTFRFIRAGALSRLFSTAAAYAVDHRSMLEPAMRCVRAIRAFEPDFVHFFGTQLHLNLWLTLRALRDTESRTIVHYHGGLPSRWAALRHLQQKNYARVDRFLFPTRHHARPFVRDGLIAEEHKILPLVTTSTSIRHRDRDAARAVTQMSGDPVFVWTGRLHPVKDPATALLGFARILEAWPDAKLYMYYTESTLLDEVTATIRRHPSLERAVHLRGSAAVSEMELIYNSADFFLQPSLREVSGFALAEAMAAGVIPVVTDIPSFRSMTDNGRYGILFPPGDPALLAEAVLGSDPDELDQWPGRIRKHFQQRLSFPAIACRLEKLYTALLID